MLGTLQADVPPLQIKITKGHPVDEPNPVWACGGRLGLCGQDPSMKVQKLEGRIQVRVRYRTYMS